MTDTTWLDRLYVEREALNLRFTKLTAFIWASDFTTRVSEAEQGRLLRQAQHMASYLAVLDERIAAAEEGK